jgi:hypothetical protein
MPVTALRLPPELRRAIEAWIAEQPEPKPHFTEAIRRLLRQALGIRS